MLHPARSDGRNAISRPDHLALRLIILTGFLPLLCHSQCPGLAPSQCGCYAYNLLTSNAKNPGRIQHDWAQQPQDGGAGMVQRLVPWGASVAKGETGLVNLNGPVIKMWPGGLIFYVIDGSFSKRFQSTIRTVLADTESLVGKSHIEFKEAVSKNTGKVCRRHYIRFEPIKTQECKAMLGMQLRGITSLWLNETYCNYPYAIQHELLHAMGRLHEHSRRDRDKHIELRHAEIFPLICANYATHPDQVVDVTASLPYDTDSIMHYESCAGSCRGQYVFVTRNGGKPVGVNSNMTQLDVQKIRLMYPAGEKVPYSARLCHDGTNGTMDEEPVVEARFRPPRRRLNDTDDGAGCLGCWSPLSLTIVVVMATVFSHAVLLG